MSTLGYPAFNGEMPRPRMPADNSVKGACGRCGCELPGRNAFRCVPCRGAVELITASLKKFPPRRA